MSTKRRAPDVPDAHIQKSTTLQGNTGSPSKEKTSRTVPIKVTHTSSDGDTMVTRRVTTVSKNGDNVTRRVTETSKVTELSTAGGIPIKVTHVNMKESRKVPVSVIHEKNMSGENKMGLKREALHSTAGGKVDVKDLSVPRSLSDVKSKSVSDAQKRDALKREFMTRETHSNNNFQKVPISVTTSNDMKSQNSRIETTNKITSSSPLHKNQPLSSRVLDYTSKRTVNNHDVNSTSKAASDVTNTASLSSRASAVRSGDNALGVTPLSSTKSDQKKTYEQVKQDFLNASTKPEIPKLKTDAPPSPPNVPASVLSNETKKDLSFKPVNQGSVTVTKQSEPVIHSSGDHMSNKDKPKSNLLGKSYSAPLPGGKSMTLLPNKDLTSHKPSSDNSLSKSKVSGKNTVHFCEDVEHVETNEGEVNESGWILKVSMFSILYLICFRGATPLVV